MSEKQNPQPNPDPDAPDYIPPTIGEVLAGFIGAMAGPLSDPSALYDKLEDPNRGSLSDVMRWHLTENLRPAREEQLPAAEQAVAAVMRNDLTAVIECPCGCGAKGDPETIICGLRLQPVVRFLVAMN